MKKDEIVAKKYGRNLIVVIDGKKITRVINTDKDKKDEVSIKNKILLYNKKNNTLLKEQIIALVDSTKASKDEEVAVKKGLKQAIKKETKTSSKKSKEIIKSSSDLINAIEKQDLTEDDVIRLNEILAKSKVNQKQTKSEPVVTKSPRQGEY
jgi:hypothetical protein